MSRGVFFILAQYKSVTFYIAKYSIIKALSLTGSVGKREYVDVAYC